MREALTALGFADPGTGRGLGFGAAGIGNLYREVSDFQAFDTLQAAYDAGARHYDTAPHYGLGLSERRLGAWLRESGARGELVISSKVGRLLEPRDNPQGALDDQGFAVLADTVRRWDPSEAGIRRSVESSLERLGIEQLDIAYLHDPDAYDLREGIEQGLPALLKLRDEGLVAAVGVGTNSAQAAGVCLAAADIDLVMLAGRYTLLEQSGAELLADCARREVGVVNVGVYNSGLLARAQVPEHANYNYSQAPQELLDRARAIASVASDFGTDLPTVAVRFAASHPAVVALVLGASSAGQAVENARRYERSVDPAVWDALAARGLLDASALEMCAP
ncbi:aldo/keto reductase [Glutamicibacter soli]|uniref:aldo/keto reductase n=1 Tax=Glutamicibacter soli TaxID=453836 RepID=UPI003C7311C7